MEHSVSVCALFNVVSFQWLQLSPHPPAKSFVLSSFFQVKLCCSLRWLYGILSKHPTTSDRGYLLRLSHLLLEPYQETTLLKHETIVALTSPSLYVQAYDVVFPGEHLAESSFEAVTQGLARKGGYVLEDDGTIVSVPMLTQQVPFREVGI